ncbi:hypothetical protein TNIN_57441 [Trichonephila inaurata madagascariensis]|uniref:Uncharacterized protein n=1 Tax=Trichonephila inaurata madagascariensis TaxID=2747483 RepID=A0A8X7CLA6_9ARAC|nr:hypothetical protein TNIN_57441 [Trichonephila inaurata madagascariensis]
MYGGFFSVLKKQEKKQHTETGLFLPLEPLLSTLPSWRLQRKDIRGAPSEENRISGSGYFIASSPGPKIRRGLPLRWSHGASVLSHILVPPLLSARRPPPGLLFSWWSAEVPSI